MRRSILIGVSLLRSLLAATLFAAPITSGATLGSAAAAFAQTADEPERANANPYYGPGWGGPVNHAPPPTCPAWYGSPTTCVPVTGAEPERVASPAFSTLESAEDDPAFAPIEATPASSSGDPYYGPGWSGPVNASPPAICPAWYSTHTACVPAASGADER